VKRVYLIAAWLAIVALLIDGLLPAAVSAAALPGRATPFALCGASGGSLPAHAPPTVPAQHFALCAVCAGATVGLLPGCAEGLTARIPAGNELPAIAHPMSRQTRAVVYPAAQPRAPPEFTS
jgi:hypothetical protein